VAYLGEKLKEFGVAVQEPFGGHAIFVDAHRILPHLPKDQFQAQTLAVELYMEGGVRGVEIGTLLADRDPVTRENRYPKLELLRLTIPVGFTPIITCCMSLPHLVMWLNEANRSPKGSKSFTKRPS
jgi:tryptophanase